MLGFGVVVLAACQEKLPRPRPSPGTPHERYAYALQELGLASTALGRDWVAAAHDALDRASPVTAPYREMGYFDPEQASAIAYRLRVERGQRLLVELQVEGARGIRMFIDVFSVADDSAQPRHRHVMSADSSAMRLVYEPRRSGEYVVRVQPELLRGGRYQVRILAGASLAFPVSGRDTRAVRSRFGAPRAAGRREHHGVDIFAPRGTPVVAAADGYVRSTRSNRLGGKVVWLRDSRRGQSLYYAHLDSQVVRAGMRISAGDTLGFVGNTGNARTTPPHLHFGIYGHGPVDPFPFLYDPPNGPERVAVSPEVIGGLVRATSAIRLRRSPGDRAPWVRNVGRHTPMQVLGGAGRWYRVLLPDGTGGFVPGYAVERADRPVRGTRLADRGVLLDRPHVTGVAVDSVRVGTELFVLGEFEEFLYVEGPSGRLAWLARPAQSGSATFVDGAAQ